MLHEAVTRGRYKAIANDGRRSHIINGIIVKTAIMKFDMRKI
ncbi:MAG: hypothetical protein ACLBM2_13005 [Dolichospermum sp.]